MKLPKEILPYASVTIDGPLAPGAIAHRRRSDPLYYLTYDDKTAVKELVDVAACAPASSLDNPPKRCSSPSAAWADQHGAEACTAPACFGDTPPKTKRRKTS